MTSLSSFLYTFLGTQSLQVRGEIGRIASPGPSFSLWLLLLGASEVSSRLGLYTAFAWSSRPSAALAAVVVLSLAAVNPLVYATFGGDRMRGGSYLTGPQEKEELLLLLPPQQFLLLLL